jgi:hypothetical protein
MLPSFVPFSTSGTIVGRDLCAVAVRPTSRGALRERSALVGAKRRPIRRIDLASRNRDNASASELPRTSSMSVLAKETTPSETQILAKGALLHRIERNFPPKRAVTKLDTMIAELAGKAESVFAEADRRGQGRAPLRLQP